MMRLKIGAAGRILTAAVLLVSAPLLAAEAPDDKAALAGLKEAKIAFDVTTGDSKRLLNVLNTIDETRQSLMKQGVTPHIVLAFRGPATRLIQTDETKIKPEDRDNAKKIAARMKELRKAPGVESFEQCSVAVRQQETKVENVLPEVKVVGNGWISLMGYQARGYAYIQP